MNWRLSGRGEAFRAHVVSYADDFVILSRGSAEEELTRTKAVMTKLGLTLNEAKTSVKDARRENFDFLGYTLGPRHFPNGGRIFGRSRSRSPSTHGRFTEVSYAGDEGGIVCRMAPEEGHDALIVSMTHVRAKRSLPFAAAVFDYQKHRVKKAEQNLT